MILNTLFLNKVTVTFVLRTLYMYSMNGLVFSCHNYVLSFPKYCAVTVFQNTIELIDYYKYIFMMCKEDIARFLHIKR